MNPIEMSKEVVSAISTSYELATYSTPELRSLFNNWLEEIERETLEFLGGGTKVSVDEVADHFRLKRDSVIFILSKLAHEGKVKMQAWGVEKL